MSGATALVNANNDFGLSFPKTAGAFNNHYSWSAGTNPNGVVVAMSPIKGTLLVICGRLEIAEGSAATVNVVIARPGLTVAQGRIITSVAFNANGAILLPQYLTVPGVMLPGGVAVSTQFAAGDIFGLVSTGSFSNNQGMIQIMWVER